GELDAVILVARVWRGHGPALIGQRCAGRPARCTPVAEIRYGRAGDIGAAARELWSALETRPHSRGIELFTAARIATADARPPGRPAAPSRGCQWCRSPWLWGGVGAGALAVGAALLLGRDGGDARPVIILDP